MRVAGQLHQGGGELAHPGAVPPNEQSIGPLAVDETDGEGGLLKGTLHDALTLPPHQAPPSEVRSNFNGTLLIPS